MLSALTIAPRLHADYRRRKSLKALQPAPPWPVEDQSEARVALRIALATADFWSFDALYFPPEVYTQGYAAPGDYHRHLVAESLLPGLYVHLGARKHGKTVTEKKLLAWLLLTGRVTIAGTLSQTLPTSRNILADVKDIIRENPRIVFDWRPRFQQDNAEQFQFVTEREGTKPHNRFCTAFSEKKSVRGYSRMFGRPEFILCDDLETRKSPLGSEQVAHRGKVLSEAFTSMAEGGTLVALGNNFDERCLMNTLLREYEAGLLPRSRRIERHPAWVAAREDRPARPLWPERFPAAKLPDLREMLQPADEEEWQGDYLQVPCPPDGHLFKREFYREWDALPKDARGVLYLDPNLAKKAKGDTTGMTALYYSPSEDRFFVVRALCRSYADSNELLDMTLAVKSHLGRDCVCIGFDGHVNQESTWSQHIRNWTTINQLPFPRIEYCRYRVDDVAKTTASVFSEKRILFPPGFSIDPEGARYLAQLWSFSGKKANGQDDAPDSLICAMELVHERGLVRTRGGQVAATVNMEKAFSW